MRLDAHEQRRGLGGVGWPSLGPGEVTGRVAVLVSFTDRVGRPPRLADATLGHRWT